MQELTQERLKEILHYDPETGIWTWIKVNKHNIEHNGKIAGTVRDDGYRSIRIGGRAYYSGRLAILYMTGKWPIEVDHKDRDPSNDCWDNLRDATSADNKCNTTLHRVNNTSGYRGVSWNKKQQKWVAYIDAFQLGAYNSLEEAIQIRDEYVAKFHGEFAVLNQQETDFDSR